MIRPPACPRHGAMSVDLPPETDDGTDNAAEPGETV